MLREKSAYYGNGRSKSQSTSTAATRLTRSASAVRAAASRGALKIKQKTLFAVIDHITQVLPGPNEGFVPPLLNDYVKALTELLSRASHVEFLSRLDGARWQVCVDFYLDIIGYCLPQNPQTELSRISGDSPAPGTPTPRSMLRSNSSNLSQKPVDKRDGDPLRNALEGLHCLVSATNAHMMSRYKDIAGTATRVLRMHHLSVGAIQTLSFAVINNVISVVQLDDPEYTEALAAEILPLMSHWWRPDKVSQDAGINSLRTEILKTTLFIQLHLEHLAVNEWNEEVRTNLEHFLDPLWLEYSKRSPSYRLQLSDITFSTANLPRDYLNIGIFGLRIHNTEGENHWAIVQCLASLEAVLLRPNPRETVQDMGREEQPRKRRRLEQPLNRLRMKLKTTSHEILQTALQVASFIMWNEVLSPDDVKAILEDISQLINHKNSAIASWAFISCSACLLLSDVSTDMFDTLTQIWHIAVRAVSLPATCRAACVAVHAIVEKDVLPYHELSEEVNSIVTTADVNGPALLCDSSLTLMFHLFHVRNSTLPSASQATANHLIRWTLLRWNPSDLGYTSTQATHVRPIDFVNLLRACCGAAPLRSGRCIAVTGSAYCEAWKAQQEISKFSKYLLLLGSETDLQKDVCCKHLASTETAIQASDFSSLFASKKLLLELLYPKFEELTELCSSWSKRPDEGGSQVSNEKFRSLLSSCIIGAMLLPEISHLDSSQSASIDANIMDLAERGAAIALSSVESHVVVEEMLRQLRPCIPDLCQNDIGAIHQENDGLLRLITMLSATLSNHRAVRDSGNSHDAMDIDDEFESQSSRGHNVSVTIAVPRGINQVLLRPNCFYLDTVCRLRFLELLQRDSSQLGLLPDLFVDELVAYSDDELLSCHAALTDLFNSDMVISPDSALNIIQRLGSIVGKTEYRCCETALTTCIDVIHGLSAIWLNDTGELANSVGDLYNHFVKSCLSSNFFSPKALNSMSALLFTLLKQNSGYGTSLGLDSCRTSLLFILSTGPMRVKWFVSQKIADLFELYILMLHDEVFVDVLGSLPADPDYRTGIAFRLLVLSNLAKRWATLLRRCTYHIFETPGKVTSISEHARYCIRDISNSLGLKSPKNLFGLFSRQLLYTWMDTDSIAELPFSIFGFDSLTSLLDTAQADAIGLCTMRGQDGTRATIASEVGKTEVALLQDNFSTAIAYSTVYTATFGSSTKEKGEDRIKKKMGSKLFVESIYTNFVDIVASYFDVMDQEDSIDKVFAKSADLAYAADNYREIVKISQSTAKLPPNQQPMFRAKYVINELARLCHGTEFQFEELWTPALVVSITRKLFNTVHPALGPLHACSVLRKVRILISLAAPVALESYCLEMLLTSVRSFIVDSECADDALGISQYLLSKGATHLKQVPSFLAGYALSVLASLRVFLESSQSSTTQESQFKATMSKARAFHDWFASYLENYTSQSFKSETQMHLFKSITVSAANIRASGNAEKSSYESKLLLDILRDGSGEDQLLNEPSRQLALGLLCGDFAVPEQIEDDIIEQDADAIQYASAVWKSCDTQRLSRRYLSWAGRVLGRAFAASGEIPSGIIPETNLAQYAKIAPGPNGSEMGLLNLLQDLTANPDTLTAGLAESVLRAAVSQATIQEDEPLLIACQRSLSEHLFLTSQWALYRSPPSEHVQIRPHRDEPSVWATAIESKDWLKDLSVLLVNAVPDSILLCTLSPIFAEVDGFAAKAFPFLVHLVLLFQLEQQQVVKRSLSSSLKVWLQSDEPAAQRNVALLLNMVLYLRTQEYPKEASIADRMHWLDVDYAMAAAAASRCGMHKTALLFAELTASETTRQSRRSSTAREPDINRTLLTVFENIDDPDAYYGLPEEASLSSVLSRVTYENEGSKSLAFRGAQYDSHIRLRHPSRTTDGQALVGALSMLGLSGLSHSFLQTQQSGGNDTRSIENTFQAARRLEIWNLPAPTDSRHHAVTTYRAYQTMHNATEAMSVRESVHDGFCRTIQNLTGSSRPSVSELRPQLSALAALSELDELLHIADGGELGNVLTKFKARGNWMRSGRYEEVGHILSCRGTTMSMLSQHSGLLNKATLSTAVMRKSEVESLLTAANIYRFHQAAQESLNISTTLSDLIPLCQEVDVHVDAAVNVEVANSLWDHGEMSTAIRMLQTIDRDSSLNKQAIPVSKADLLAKIGDRTSVARLEKPRDIQKKYLEPALKEIGSSSYGKEAGMVFHQFALFCDGQLQDADGLEDLERLQNLRKGKSDEVAELKSLIASTKETQLRKRYDYVLSKEKQWLELDEQELRRVEQTRSEFVRLSVENYLLSLIASDEHNNDALRFTALWLERSEEDGTNKAVARHLAKVPTRKFAALMNQLTSRLQYNDSAFQKLLLELVYNICVDHPYHGMYQIWSGTKVRVQQKDEVAVQRVKATDKVAQRLAGTKAIANIWLSIEKTSKYYHGLAMDRDPNKYKAGAKFPLKDSNAGQNLVIGLAKYKVPPPTMHIEVSTTRDYSAVPMVAKLEPTMTIAGGVSAPKIITAIGTDGKKYKQLVKGGHDDLRQDAIMEQVFSAVSSLLKLHRSTQQRNLGIRTYKVLPLTASSGLIEFVPNTIPLHEFLMPAHERYYPRDLKGSQCRKEIYNVQSRNMETRISTYRKVTERFHPVMRYFFMEYFEDPDDWFLKRLAYTRTTAAISMLGHVLGLGDRHGHNILLDSKTGEAVHIDLGVAFEAGRILPVPELVPFRLTRDIVDGMGITKTEGVFRRCCEFTLDALREEQYSIMTILDVLRYDPLYTWSISPLRLAKLQKARGPDEATSSEDPEQSDAESKKGKKKAGHTNEPSEADRALEVVRKKLSKALSVTATVNDLINQATDERNLAVLYSGKYSTL